MDRGICNILTDLKSCSLKRDLEWGRRIHATVLETGHGSNVYIATAMIKMYGSCGSMLEAQEVFDTIRKPDVVSFTALLLGYADNGEGRVSLTIFSKMKAEGCAPNSVTYLAALKACISLVVNGDGIEGLKVGRIMHSEIGVHLNLKLQNALIDMYAKCASMLEARRVFESIEKPDIVSWNALLLGYAENGEGYVSLQLFCKMKVEGLTPNSFTYVASLKACTSLAVNEHGSRQVLALEIGRSIHSETGCHLNLYVENTLVDMYAKCGSMRDARWVFDTIEKPDVVSWNALLLGYAVNGEGHICLELFSKMKADGCSPDSGTYVAFFKACSSLAMTGGSGKAKALEMGCKLHAEIGDHDHLHPYVQSALIETYSKCGNMFLARQVFESARKPDLVSWNALLLGYAENGEGCVSLELFSKMKADGCAPNSVTYLAVLKSCTSLPDGDKARGLEVGRSIQLEPSCHSNLHLQNALIDMYAKCGNMLEAHQVFDSIQKPSVVSWAALLLGYANNGEGLVALDLFSKMKTGKCAPDSVTYLAALKACGSIGALSLGRKFHSDLSEFTVQIVSCLVDLYAKCGSMLEARQVFDLHSKTRDIAAWNSLLAGYASCGDTDAVFSIFEAMQDTGFRPDGITFVCLLMSCSHGGLPSKARQYLEAMPVQYGVYPDLVHYNCMVDVLGRASRLNEAIVVLRRMPCNPSEVTWRALLDACWKWKNLVVGTVAFQSLVEIDRKDASAYITMARIYGTRGLWHEQETVLEWMQRHCQNRSWRSAC